jgi:hypothetical protein
MSNKIMINSINVRLFGRYSEVDGSIVRIITSLDDNSKTPAFADATNVGVFELITNSHPY